MKFLKGVGTIFLAIVSYFVAIGILAAAFGAFGTFGFPSDTYWWLLITVPIGIFLDSVLIMLWVSRRVGD